jgi:hypothetical protein
MNSSNGYSHLPSQEPTPQPSFTVKSTGQSRFCKKCQSRKPDRAHHCSTCRRCVLKMDHHCPWLASCLGLRNYKPFLLFLIYTTLFCWICFAVTASWVWSEVLSDGQFGETLLPLNPVLLAAISGIIGIVLAGFTGWHIMLACRGLTTIECLEKTRYLSPLRRSLHQQHQQQHRIGNGEQPGYGQQLLDMHTNALPGITRPEEGEERPSPVQSTHPSAAQRSLHRNYDEMQQLRERERYEEYLDEKDSEKLPHAFDLGWRRNLHHLLGPKKSLWAFPICNTTGDGWTWEPSPKWLKAREDLRRERENQQQRPSEYDPSGGRHYLSDELVRPPRNKADQILGRDPSQYTDNSPSQTVRPPSGVSMQTLHGKYGGSLENDHFEVSGDEDEGANNGPSLLSDGLGRDGRKRTTGAAPASEDQSAHPRRTEEGWKQDRW